MRDALHGTPGPEGRRRDVFRVVLAHGRADAELVARAAAELRARAQLVELVELDGDDAPLLEACARAGGHGLFVVARGALDGPRVDRLREVLRDLGVPMSRSLALALDAAGPSGFVERVIIVARRIGAAAEGPPPPGAPKLSSAAAGEASAIAAGSAAPSVLEPPTSPRVSTVPPTATVPHVHLGARTDRARSRAPIGLFVATLGVAAVVALAYRDDAAPVAEPEPTELAHAPSPASPEPVVPPQPKLVPEDEPILDDAPVQVSATTTADEDAPAVVDALRKREVRALDVFVVSPESRKPAEFAGAYAYCDKLKVAGLGDWRLPEIGELISMGRAKMVRKGSFWSATKGDTFGDLRLVLVVKRERISPIPAGWDGGRVICVRERA
jgi:hypothetical protein